MNIKYSQKLPQDASVNGKHLSAAQDRSPDSTDYRINTNISNREVQLIITTLEKYKDIAIACRALGVSRATFYRKCKAHGITASDYI